MAEHEDEPTAAPDAVTAWTVRLSRGRRISGSAFRAGGCALRVPRRRPNGAAEGTAVRVPAQRTALVREDRGAP